MDPKEWFDQQLREFENDPEALADEAAFQIVADIYQAMLRQGLTRKQLAERIGCSPAFVSQVLNGKPNMTLVTLAKFALALDLECHVELRQKQDHVPGRAVEPSRRRQPLKPASPRRPRRAAATPA